MFKTWEEIRQAIDEGGEILEAKVKSFYIKKKSKTKKSKKRSRK